MPPFSDGTRTDTRPKTRTVGCQLAKFVPSEQHLEVIREAVGRVHRATIHATELVNVYVRLCIEHGVDASDAFDDQWLGHVYNEVTVKDGNKGRPRAPTPPLLKKAAELLPAHELVNSKGLCQILRYECRNLAAVASTNVWMHFRKRVHSYVRLKKGLAEPEYKTLSKKDRKCHKLKLALMANDLLRIPDEEMKCPVEEREWVAETRRLLFIDNAVGEWDGKPIEYHLKARPGRFLPAMSAMSKAQKNAEKGSFSLFPLRRSMVPRHCRFDVETLHDLITGPEETARKRDLKQAIAARKKELKAEEASNKSFGKAGAKVHSETTKRVGCEKEQEVKKKARTEASSGDKSRAPKRHKDDPSLIAEKEAVFSSIVNQGAVSKTPKRWVFDHAFTTDGVCVRVQYRLLKSKCAPVARPRRGLYAIDELKRQSRVLDSWHVVGVDPGKRELICAVDGDAEKGGHPLRYTQQQRQRDRRSRQYADESRRGRPAEVFFAQDDLRGFDSRAADLEELTKYLLARRAGMKACLDYYSHLDHRRRRWKSCIKLQKSEEKLYRDIRAKFKTDRRPLVLAYGMWGSVAGRPGAACNKGNPPCVGAGLMRKLSKRFVVALTPEAYTSKTCNRCLHPCGAWKEVEEEMGKKKTGIRGLRRCTQRDCMLPLNRDQNAASNIALQFKRLFSNQGPIREMSAIEQQLTELKQCIECAAEE